MSFLETKDKRTAGLLWLLFLWIVLRNSWLSEDSFITFRVVDNLVHGYGARWNVLERVQVYTHPLWMLCLAALYTLTRSIYFCATVLSLACTGGAAWLLLTRALASNGARLTACVLLCFSKAFVDYSTGGLENPLSHLILVLYFLEYLKPQDQRSASRMVWLASLALVNRMDLVWLLLPSMAHVLWLRRAWHPREWAVLIGLLPFVAWEIFSLVYYGFLLPNTAYAKLTPDVGRLALVQQGCLYLLNSLAWDPLTLFSMVALVAIGIAAHEAGRPLVAVTLGVLLQIVYLVFIGGDYMSGRFLAAPFLVCLFLLRGLRFEAAAHFAVVMAVALAIGVAAPRPPILTSDQYVNLGSSPQDVDDEHGYRHFATSLLRRSRTQSLADLDSWAAKGIRARDEHQRVTVFKNIGYYGFFAGPGVHVIDPYGLGDPLLARLPPDGEPGRRRWSAGHFLRAVPKGYAEAILSEGQIEDPVIADYNEKLTLLTRAPIWSGARWREIVRFNLGQNPAPGR